MRRDRGPITLCNNLLSNSQGPVLQEPDVRSSSLPLFVRALLPHCGVHPIFRTRGNWSGASPDWNGCGQLVPENALVTSRLSLAAGPGDRPAVRYTLTMDDEPHAAIFDAIEQGRGQRGRNNPQAWSRDGATMPAAQQGLSRGRLGGQLGVSAQQVIVLLAEACDAVLRGGAASDAADRACVGTWRRWCESGDTAGCERLWRGASKPA
jgi:hypothetical protein